MEYVIESASLKNLFALLVFDFNTPLDVSTNDCKRYFLIQKNKQFAEVTGICLFMKLCTMLDDVNKYQEICIQILEELIKEMENGNVTEIEYKNAIDIVLAMKNEEYNEQLLKLFAFYWDFKTCLPLHYHSLNKILSEISPFCKIVIILKESEENFKDLFLQYLTSMRMKYRGHYYEMMVQRDCKYFLAFQLSSGMDFQLFIHRQIAKFQHFDVMHPKSIFVMMSPAEIKIQVQEKKVQLN